jgi:hypothetical protein
VLEGRGVIDDLWAILFEDFSKQRAIGDVAEDGDTRRAIRDGREFCFDLMKIALGVLQKNQAPRLRGHDGFG